MRLGVKGFISNADLHRVSPSMGEFPLMSITIIWTKTIFKTISIHSEFQWKISLWKYAFENLGKI